MTKYVLEFHGEAGATWAVAAPGDERRFHLAKSQVTIQHLEGDSSFVEAEVPEWLAKRHRQLVGDEAYKAEKAKRKK